MPEPSHFEDAYQEAASSALAYDVNADGAVTEYLVHGFEPKRLYSIFKRLGDMIVSTLALLILSPLFLIVAIAIRLDSKGPAIYTQQRVGKNGKLFKMYKFRSMCCDADEKLAELQRFNEVDGPVFKMAQDPRVTRVGRVIRKCSIDEFPQLVNILRGEMSVVGPRPPIPKEVEKYTPYQRQRLGVTPGLTCYWQISGRSDTTFKRWGELDLQYIRDRSLLIDLKIILRTIPVVLFGVGAY